MKCGPVPDTPRCVGRKANGGAVVVVHIQAGEQGQGSLGPVCTPRKSTTHTHTHKSVTEHITAEGHGLGRGDRGGSQSTGAGASGESGWEHGEGARQAHMDTKGPRLPPTPPTTPHFTTRMTSALNTHHKHHARLLRTDFLEHRCCPTCCTHNHGGVAKQERGAHEQWMRGWKGCHGVE